MPETSEATTPEVTSFFNMLSKFVNQAFPLSIDSVHILCPLSSKEAGGHVRCVTQLVEEKLPAVGDVLVTNVDLPRVLLVHRMNSFGLTASLGWTETRIGGEAFRFCKTRIGPFQ